jgi:hypothetical protein
MTGFECLLRWGRLVIRGLAPNSVGDVGTRAVDRGSPESLIESSTGIPDERYAHQDLLFGWSLAHDDPVGLVWPVTSHDTLAWKGAAVTSRVRRLRVQRGRFLSFAVGAGHRTRRLEGLQPADQHL